MRAALATLLLLAAALPAAAAPPAADGELTGDWWTPGFNARVRIEPCGEAFCGRIVWLWDEAPQDVADRGPLLGRRVVDGMRAAAAGRWQGGRLYNPEDGRDYQGALQLQPGGRLRVEGCVLFVCRTQLWRRADATRCPPVAAP